MTDNQDTPDQHAHRLISRLIEQRNAVPDNVAPRLQLDSSVPPLRLDKPMSRALKEAAYECNNAFNWGHGSLQHIYEYMPDYQEAIQNFEQKISDFHRILKSSQLQFVWVEIEKHLSLHPHEKRVKMYISLLVILVDRLGRLSAETLKAGEKRRDRILAKIKDLRRAVADDQVISRWSMHEDILWFPWQKRVFSCVILPEKKNPTLLGFLDRLQEAVEAESKKKTAANDPLAPRKHSHTADRVYLGRKLAAFFRVSFNETPYPIIAKLTEVALQSGPLDPETLRKDMNRQEKSGQFLQK